jgi:hypothetical protein
MTGLVPVIHAVVSFFRFPVLLMAIKDKALTETSAVQPRGWP